MPRLPLRTAARTAIAVAAVATLGATLAACSSSSSTPASTTAAVTTLNYQTSWIPLVQFGGSYVAEKEGYYAANKVKVNILPGGPDVDGMAALEAGKADIAVSNPDVVARANAQAGGNLVIVAAGFQKSPLAIMSLSTNPINTPADMKGKKIGVPTGDAATNDAFTKLNGISSSDYTSVPVSFDVAPTLSGDVAGQYVFATEQPIAVEAAGKTPTTMLLADHGMNEYAQVYVVTKDTLAKKRAAIEGFLKGEIKGWQNYVADPTEAVALTVNDYGKSGGLTIKEQTRQAQLQMPIIVTDTTKAHGLLWMSAEDIDANIATIKALGVTADKSLFDTSLLEDIYQGASSLK
ncbi:ABC transporter substrate-binding protein [Galbitalea soli]|uniref:Thiamine pyrimidine synthase n=1 Tax=Galbitalea soli TaxID=1268042 RepID=A0A7C9TSZ0_9MICO|nr:ABC transporter substrate-binding protein [Galbitalea soli]NEM92064.1 ABC transporter substrate-binding protein [Galbitalea soli]NYJ31984.1 ABC-type nitrate/sulfonate/bicarbonate transport system substrate-binding protein [Galbitalea soli]